MMNIFYNKRMTNVVILLKNSKRLYVTQITKKTHYTHGYLNSTLLKALKSKELIISEKEGRVVYISLTEKGEKLANYLIKTNKLLN